MPERADAAPPRDIWITGIGILSSLGEGPEAHLAALEQNAVHADAATFAPFVIHPLPAVDFDKQIPKKGDQRQMEPWQRIGVYAAGLALESAGLKGQPDILSRTDMIVAATGGERDIAVDDAIMAELAAGQADDKAIDDKAINERLMTDLRPTLFLAQLPNLLAGNISIVHGVTGSSRTFMGEEAAGIDAVRLAHARIAAGQSDIALVGGSYNAARKDMLMLYEFGGFNLKDRFAPVWERGPAGGLALGSMGAFLVLEAADHARARGAAPFAKLTAVVSDRSRRGSPDDVQQTLSRLWDRIGAAAADESRTAVISGATGAEPATAAEHAFLQQRGSLPVRATGSRIGHGFETQFPMNVALAALAVRQGRLFPATPGTGAEAEMPAPLARAVVTGVGHWRGEGLALVERIEGAADAG